MIPRKITARELMTPGVSTCRPEDTLRSAALIMRERHCGCMPVVAEDDRPVAMLTDRDVCLAAYKRDAPLSTLYVREAMSKAIYTCKPDDSLVVAERMMREHKVRRLAIVDRDARLVGLLSLSDIAREAARDHVAATRDASADGLTQTLAAVSETEPSPPPPRATPHAPTSGGGHR